MLSLFGDSYLGAVRGKVALLVSKEPSPLLASRPCIKPQDKKELRELLKVFSFDMQLSSQIAGGNVGHEDYLEDFDLLIFDLTHANVEDLWFIPTAMEDGLPCLIIGEPGVSSKNVFQSTAMTTEYGKIWFPKGIYWFSCKESLFAALTLLTKFSNAVDSWRKVVRRVKKTFPYAMVQKILSVDLQNMVDKDGD